MAKLIRYIEMEDFKKVLASEKDRRFCRSTEKRDGVCDQIYRIPSA